MMISIKSRVEIAMSACINARISEPIREIEILNVGPPSARPEGVCFR